VAGEEQRSRLDRWTRIGVVIFAIGAACTLATVLPLFLDTPPLPTAFYGLSMLMPVGLGIVLAGLVSEVRRRERRARDRAPGRAPGGASSRAPGDDVRDQR
jgi:hypothetical protein